nr:RecName: Full=Uncharacterized protein SMPP17 [Nautilus macromphalus]
LSLQEFLGLWR